MPKRLRVWGFGPRLADVVLAVCLPPTSGFGFFARSDTFNAEATIPHTMQSTAAEPCAAPKLASSSQHAITASNLWLGAALPLPLQPVLGRRGHLF